MEAQTRFCTMPNGVRIAYATFGHGQPLVLANGCWLSMSHDLEEGIGGPFYRTLAKKHTVILYDRRGTGLSDRDRTEFTIEADYSDLAALVNHLDIGRFVLLGNCALGGAAVTYAARHEDRVSKLILYATWAHGPSMTSDDIKSSFISQARSHWGLGSRTIAGMLVPESDGEIVDRVAAAMRESCDSETAASFLEMMYAADVTDVLPTVKIPTLVLQRRNDRGVPFRAARDVCSSLPDAQLVALQGHHHLISYGDFEVVLDAIEEFLGEGEEAAAGAEPPEAGAFRTVLFTDVEGSTAFTQRLGDAKAREVLREHERMVREALKAHGGAEVKALGDGFMASFSSATKALECAIAMQRAFAEHNESAEEPIRVRVGLNAGEPIAEDDDLFGTAVNLAARIAAQAAGGEVLASDVVRQLVAGKEFLLADRGEASLKGFDETVRLYEVRWQEEGG